MDAYPTLRWLAECELPTGGLAAWRNLDGACHIAYPEVTGYCIPTLLQYGRADIVARLMDWLLAIQNPSGSWYGLHGSECLFDTAAIIQGLSMFESGRCKRSVQRAKDWIIGQLGGSLDNGEIYHVRTRAIVGASIKGINPWKKNAQERTHYLAYMLEGWYLAGQPATKIKSHLMAALHAAVENTRGLLPYWVGDNWQPAGGTDIPATAQVAWLCGLYGLDASPLYTAIEKQLWYGGTPQEVGSNTIVTWGAKYLLDGLYANY